MDQSTSSGDSLSLNDSQIRFIEKYGLKAFVERVEDQMVSHFFKKNNDRVRRTLKILRISNSAFYRISKRVKEKARAGINKLRG
jgi:hypothetical protein